MKNLRKFLLLALLFVFFQALSPLVLTAQAIKKIPGTFSGQVGTGQKYELQAAKVGKYLFEFKRQKAEKKQGFVSVSPKFQNNVKIELRAADGSVLGSNFYPGNESKPEPHYSDYFSVELSRPQKLVLEISPLSPDAQAQSFYIVTDFIAPRTMIMGMELSNFLAMIATFVLLAGMWLFYRFIIKPLKGMNVQEIMEKGEALRAARQKGEAGTTGVSGESAKSAKSTPETASFCGKCGLPREPGADFCGECGTRFED